MNKSKKHVEGDKKNIESGLIISKPAKNTAYFVPAISPDEKGPGILVLHSWWGLNSSIKKYCEKLSDLGYCVMAPDLFGTLANNEKHAQLLLNQADPNEMADLILSSIHALRTYSRDSTKPICIIGFAMGGSLGLWASTKLPDSVSCVVSVYGSQNVDFVDAKADFLLISAENDNIATDDDMSFTEALIALSGASVISESIPGTTHGFWDENDNSFNVLAKEFCEIAISNFLVDHFRI
ncbi:MAG: dienelactone hydrolase family protein [Acidimicrobiia bacterium]|mgnify:CR=1 FL=1|nr:dienelactone hydrolase family protein [Acidimicrobiia bacterium]